MDVNRHDQYHSIVSYCRQYTHIHTHILTDSSRIVVRNEANGFKHDEAICISFWEIKHQREQTDFPIYIDKKWWVAEKLSMPHSVRIVTSWDAFVASGVSMFSVTSAIVLGLLPSPLLDRRVLLPTPSLPRRITTATAAARSRLEAQLLSANKPADVDKKIK
jgi:hypothetical protein